MKWALRREHSEEIAQGTGFRLPARGRTRRLRPWAVSASWLRDNWTVNVYAESDTEKIQVRSGSSPPPDSSPSQQHALS
ncbi:hypothetical protein AB0G97_22825 [Streptomyces sp. NPDC020755]|uniref:hypothetical protein n=1 Tax=Streptomyces sp. NPDC020755 TaxID=3154790 RepID=UPI0033DA22DE